MTVIYPKNWFLILKHTKLGEKEAETKGLTSSKLNLHFPQNFGTSTNGHVTVGQGHTVSTGFTTQHKSQL